MAALVAALAMAFAAQAQAHEPYTGKAWGWNAHGELGDGSVGGPEECAPFREACSTSPLTISGLVGVTKISGGAKHALALLEAGTVVAWGGNAGGELGDGDGSGEPSGVPVPVCEVGYTGPAPCPSGHLLTGVTDVAAGDAFSLATLANGTVVAWGAISGAQLGDGTTKQSNVPVVVCEIGYAGPAPCPSEHYLKGATAVAAGESFALARLESGEVAAWGKNTLGDGSEAGSDVPVKLSGLSGVTAVAARNNDGYALTGGKVMAWGNNKEGQLGDGTETSSDAPVEVSGLSGVAAIAAGGGGALALLQASGKVMAWGENATGQLGDGTSAGPEMCGSPPTNACAKNPVEVSGLSGITALSAGSNFGLALRADRTLAAWGSNGLGQLGTGSNLGPEPCRETCSTKPVTVSGLADIKGIGAAVSSGYAFGPQPPSVAAISPDEVGKRKGTTVTITGSNLEEATEVKFGSAKAASFTVNSEGSITALAPAGTGIVDVTVTTPAGTSPTSSADKFYYQRPTIKKRLSPRQGPESGGTTVIITGTNFTGATAVKFGATEATSYEVNSPTSIIAVSPAHTKGRVDVTITTPNGTSVISGKDRFNYVG